MASPAATAPAFKRVVVRMKLDAAAEHAEEAALASLLLRPVALYGVSEIWSRVLKFKKKSDVFLGRDSLAESLSC